MIVTIATVKGFQNGIRNKVVQVHGSYIVDHAANVEGAEPMVVSSIHLPKFVDEALSPRGIKPAGVKHLAVSASKACIVKGESELDGVVAKGMSHRDFQFGMSGFVTKRCVDSLTDGRWVYISQAMADRLRLDTGDHLTLVFFVNDSLGRGR
ncbi:MAG: hypothetical protein ACO3AR_04100, partial [Bacteroidia bacterium]